MTENEQKADLIKKALIIVDELAAIDVEEMEDGGNTDDINFLIERAIKLKKDRLWKLK
jgi:hypothetical protein